MSELDRPLSASMLMERLMDEARRASDARRLGTLTRLVEACDELLSGDAYKRAKKANRDAEFFNPHFLRLNSNAVHQYVRLRAHLDGSGTSWTGPVATTIRGDKELKSYVKIRDQEAQRPAKPKSRGGRSQKLEEIVDALQNITDQAILRQALADGRTWKRQLDIVLATLRRIPSIDIDALREGKVLSSSQARSGMDEILPEEVHIARKLLTRFQDNDQLKEFGLKFTNGRVKMDIAPGLDLVFPEEIGLLTRLGGSGNDL